jgi:enoyl-CoA hydratase/carnithine racemase
MEAILGADDFDAEMAERYGWVNRALPAATIDEFVSVLARRIATFPDAGYAAVKDRVNAITLAPLDDFRRDSDLFGASVTSPETQRLIHAAMRNGLQTPDAELELGATLGDLGGM